MGNENIQEKESIENLLKRLEEIVIDLERGDLPLEQAIVKYEEGCQRYQRCHAILDSIEKKIVLLSKKDDGTIAEVPFNPEQSKNFKR